MHMCRQLEMVVKAFEVTVGRVQQTVTLDATVLSGLRFLADLDEAIKQTLGAQGQTCPWFESWADTCLLSGEARSRSAPLQLEAGSQ